MSQRSSRLKRAITTLRLHDFRNYNHLTLELDGRPVAMYGPNGAGKTNVLEAISCLAQGRGLRRSSTSEITRRTPEDGANWVVSADLTVEAESHRIGVGQDPQHPTRRLYRLDGETATASAVGALARVVWLTPAQDRVFAGPRGDRLRFFDRLTLAMAPGHGSAANAYDRAVRERTRLLEDNRADTVWLDAIEAEMARHGMALATARVAMAEQVQAVIQDRPATVFPKAVLALSGFLEDRLSEGDEPDAVELDFRDALARARSRDARAGRALEGPHRTDLLVQHREKSMPAGECSTGEQKALLVGISLAHARAISETTNTAAPIVLLDEAAAHLDPARREALADEICALGVQAWLTGTDASLFDAFGARAQFAHIDDGAVAWIGQRP